MSFFQSLMGMASIIVGMFILRYCNNTRQNKGPILSSSYLSLTEEERKNVDKEKEYKRLTISYGLIGIFFINLSFLIFTMMKIFGFIALAIIAVDLIYFVINAIAANK